MKSTRVILILAALLVCVPLVSAQLTYTILDVPNASTSLSGINNNGVISGNFVSNASYGSFTWQNGVFSYFSVPGALYSAAIGINDSNVVAGYYKTSTNEIGFTYDGQSFTNVQYPNVPYTELFGINNAGLLVGYEAPDTADYNGLTFDGTQFHTFIVPGFNSWSTWAYGVNNLGAIVGQVDLNGLSEGFLRVGGRYKTFLYPGAITTAALGINDAGIVVGTYASSTTLTGCFYMKNGKFKSFSIPSLGDETFCTGISNGGVIVGFVLNSDKGTYHGFYTSPVADADFK